MKRTVRDIKKNARETIRVALDEYEGRALAARASGMLTAPASCGRARRA